MYRRTRPAEFLLPVSLLLFAGLLAHVFFGLSWRPAAAQAAPVLLGLSQDDIIRNALTGSWIVPRNDAADDQDIDLRTLRSFAADGTGDIYLYDEAACSNIVQATPFKWDIKDGYLDTNLDGEAPVRYRIVSIDAQSFVYRSSDGSTSHRRYRAESCAR